MNKRICVALISASSILALASSSVLAQAPVGKGDRMSSHGVVDAPILRAVPVLLPERSPNQMNPSYGWSPNAGVDRASSPDAGGAVQ